MSVSRAERLRERIEALMKADPGRSARSIAKEVHCSPNTVLRLRRLHVQVNGADGTVNGAAETEHRGSANLMAPAERGNDRAASHGAYSQKRREPLEAMHRERLRLAYPNAADDLVNSAAKRAAMIDLFSAWIEDVGAIHPNRGLPLVSDPARELRRLLNDHEGAIRELLAPEAEASKVDPQAALDAYVAGLSENDGEEVVDGDG
jgi:hypothetical protein